MGSEPRGIQEWDGEYSVADLLDAARSGDEKTKSVLRFLVAYIPAEESGIVGQILESGVDLEPAYAQLTLGLKYSDGDIIEGH